MDRMKNKVAVVTGASVGIGAAIGTLLARKGAAVALCDIQDREGHGLAEKIRSDGGQARYWHLDVSDEQEVERVFREVSNEFGKIDVLVNNAGISGPSKPTHEITEEEWDRVQSVNVKGVFFCTKHAIPAIRRAGGGSIVNLSSIYGLVGAPDAPPYHASKGAVRLMTKTDALYYAKDGIRVNSVHPGFIWTPMVEKFLASQGNAEPRSKSPGGATSDRATRQGGGDRIRGSFCGIGRIELHDGLGNRCRRRLYGPMIRK